MSTQVQYVNTYVYSGDSTQLLYLRSRYYASGTGRFLTRDTWGGDYNRPLSLNRWMYVEGNPVNFTDPSGREPNPGDIGAGRTVYSCSCGWIDLGHAVPFDRAGIYFTLLERRPNKPQNLNVRDDVLVFRTRKLAGAIEFNTVIKTGLSESVKNEVVLGIMMAHEEFYEDYIFTRWHSSSYSEEDLVSDLLGYYMWVNGVEGNPQFDDSSFYWLSRKCGFPSDRQEAEDWSLEVYDSYLQFGFEDVYEWATPRLICTSATQELCGIRRSFPQIFQTISPQMASINGNWWEYQGYYRNLLPSNLADVFFILDRENNR